MFICINCKQKFKEIPEKRNNECISGYYHDFVREEDIIHREIEEPREISETWCIKASLYSDPGVTVFASEQWKYKYPKGQAWWYGNDVLKWIISELEIPPVRTGRVKITAKLLEIGR